MSLRSRNKVNPNFNMSSLADIIFLLLIFFLISSRLVTPNSIPIKRPSTNIKTSKTATATITVDEMGNYFVDGEEVSYGQLKSAVANKISGEEKPVVTLDMDKSLSIEKLVDLYNLAHELRFEMVLNANPKKE